MQNMNLITRALLTPAKFLRPSIPHHNTVVVSYSRSSNLHIIVHNNTSRRLSSTTTHTCWKCSNTHNNNKQLFCPHCNVIQKPEKKNLFDVLNTDRKFTIDTGALKRRYIELQARLHPDNFATSSDTEQELSSQHSTLVNEAYNILSEPIKRALYLLQLHGHTLDSETVEGGEESGELLRDVFTLNFEVEESQDVDQLGEILSSVEESILLQIRTADDAFVADDFVLAKQAIVKLKYYYNIKETINEKVFKLTL